jgi:hypothetical protein
LAGWVEFTDGEGCFTCSTGKNPGFSFNLNMSQEENIKVLQHLCILFNERLVSKHTVGNVFEYRIGGVQNCKKVFFFYYDNYPLYTKKSIFFRKEIHKDLIC